MTDSTRRPLGARLSLGGLAVAAVLALAGCGDQGGTVVDPAADPENSDVTPTASASPSASPSSSASASASPSESASSDPTAVPTLDATVAQGVQPALQDQFPALIPTAVPEGWSVQQATYDAGARSWTITMTDAQGRPVVLTHVETSLPDLVAATVGQGAQQDGTVDLSTSGLGKWRVYTAGATTGIGRALSGTAVVITAPDTATAQQLGETLITAEDANMPEAG